MKLKELLDCIRSSWIKQEDGTETQVRIDIITCPVNNYIEDPSNYLGDLIVSYRSDYVAEYFLKDKWLNCNVVEFAVPDRDVVLIQIEEEE